jgi:hypothetical protein
MTYDQLATAIATHSTITGHGRAIQPIAKIIEPDTVIPAYRRNQSRRIAQ